MKNYQWPAMACSRQLKCTSVNAYRVMDGEKEKSGRPQTYLRSNSWLLKSQEYGNAIFFMDSGSWNHSKNPQHSQILFLHFSAPHFFCTLKPFHILIISYDNTFLVRGEQGWRTHHGTDETHIWFPPANSLDTHPEAIPHLQSSSISSFA